MRRRFISFFLFAPPLPLLFPADKISRILFFSPPPLFPHCPQSQLIFKICSGKAEVQTVKLSHLLISRAENSSLWPMAFIGHPILADIRKGIRLRPTQTVDKSRPMIKAEGESLGDYKPRGPDQSQADSPAPLFFPPPPPSAPAALKSPCRPPPNGPPSAPPPPPIAASSNKPMDENQRQKLLAQIRGGVRLRHVQTVDKSGLVLDEQEKQQLLRATTPNGSLDSQGKSPSPSMASSSSMLSPSPPGGPIWPCSDSPSSDHFAPSPRNCSPSPSTRHWPEVLTEKQKMEINSKKQSDFQFDEQKQIEERQKEVAALTGRGGAQSRIAAFQQFQGRAAPQPQKCPQPHQKAAAAFCTLPRAQKLGAAGGAKMENGKAANGGPKVNGGPQQNVQNGGSRQNGQRPAAQQNGQIQSENNLQRSNSSSLQFAHPPPPSQFAPSALHVPPPQPQYFPPAAPSIAAPSPSTASAPPPFFRSYTPRIGQSAGGAHRQNFERIRGRFADGNGKEEEGEEKGAVALWKEAARQRKGQMNGQKSPIPPPLPNCPPPPLLQNGQQIPDWDSLREQFKFAVDLDGGPEGTKLIRIVRR